jgi:hypothetical protein
MNRFSTALPFAAALCLLTGGALAQVPAQPAPAAFALVVQLDDASLDPEALRSALVRELGVPVERVTEAQRAHLQLAGSSHALAVAFVREDGTRVERTLDVSSLGANAPEAVALLAANLARDEAAELLAAMHASQPVPPSPNPNPNPSPNPSPNPNPNPVPAPREPRGCDPTSLPRIPFGVDFLPYLGMSTLDGARVARAISFNVIGGFSGALRGFELGSVLNLQSESMCGAQISGVTNIVAGPAAGLQLSLVNYSRRFDGLQLGLIDVAGGNIAGSQIGLVNVGTRDVQGAQIGLVNTASRVHGAMIGLVNVAEDADAPIGLVNVMWRGRTQLDVWGTESGLALIGLEHGGRRVHNIYGAGVTTRHGHAVLVAALGIGVRSFDGERMFVDVDALGYTLLARNSDKDRMDMASIVQLRVPIGWRVTREIGLFVAPALNLSLIDETDNLLAGPSLIGDVRLTKKTSKPTVRMWPGIALGARFF